MTLTASKTPKKKRRAASAPVAGMSNIINAFAKGSGKPVVRSRRDGSIKEIININFAPPPPPSPTVSCPKC
ncbi:unnamed protein product, partial [Ectocarpus sp. 12 AP-2014]